MSAPGTNGWLPSLRRLSAAAVDVLHTRVELATTELEEQAAHAAGIFLMALLAFLFATLGVILAVLFLVIAFWDDHRLLVSGGLALLFLAAAAIAALAVQRRARQRPRLLAATLQELERDRDWLRPSA